MTRYGYARVSTKDQKLDRQIEWQQAGLPSTPVALVRCHSKQRVTLGQEGPPSLLVNHSPPLCPFRQFPVPLLETRVPIWPNEKI